MGFSYNTGRGTDVNKTLAMRWFCMAAAQGHGAAMLELSKAYYDATPNNNHINNSVCDWGAAARHLALAVDTMHRDYRKWAVNRALLRLRMTDEELAAYPAEWRQRELYQLRSCVVCFILVARVCVCV